MIRTTEPVVIMTKSELDALVDQVARKAVAEAMKAFQHSNVSRTRSASRTGHRAADKASDLSHRGSMVGMEQEDGQRLLRIEEVAKRLGVSKASIYNFIRKKAFPIPIKLGSASAWCARDVDAWIAQQASSKN